MTDAVCFPAFLIVVALVLVGALRSILSPRRAPRRDEVHAEYHRRVDSDVWSDVDITPQPSLTVDVLADHVEHNREWYTSAGGNQVQQAEVLVDGEWARYR